MKAEIGSQWLVRRSFAGLGFLNIKAAAKHPSDRDWAQEKYKFIHVSYYDLKLPTVKVGQR